MSDREMTVVMQPAHNCVPLNSLTGVTSNLLDLLECIEDVIDVGNRLSTRWNLIGVRMQSPLTLEIAGQCEEEPAFPQQITAESVQGMLDLEARKHLPRHFNTKALSKARDLARQVGNGLAAITIAAGGASVSPTGRLACYVDELTRESACHTQLEGTVEMVTVRGRKHFNMYDVASDRGITCYFADAMLAEVLDAFGKRVVAYGMGRFDHEGAPLSLEVEELRQQAQQDELPQFSDLEGIDITGGLNPTEYIRRLRDAT